MTHRFWFKIVMFVLAMSTLLIGQQTNAQPRVVRIGVVVDGPWEGNEYVRGLSQQEIGDLLRGEFDVRFPDDKYIIADWSIQGVKSA
ncbi:MAG: hypothetical protein V3U73_01740, partial [bacterium]